MQIYIIKVFLSLWKCAVFISNVQKVYLTRENKIHNIYEEKGRKERKVVYKEIRGRLEGKTNKSIP